MKIRVIKPSETIWIERPETDFIEAIQNYHSDHMHCGVEVIMVKGDNQRETISYALFESETGEKLISRMFASRIYRRGGVPPLYRGRELEYVAGKLGVTVEDLSGPWENEQTEYRSGFTGESVT